MKLLTILLLSTILNASCNEQNKEASSAFFFEATQAKTLERQIDLLQKSLDTCFSYEVEVSLLMLQATQSSDANKMKLYDKALKSLSQIKNNDALVLQEQNKINQLLAKLHESKELKAIYENKVIEPHNNQEQKTPYWAFILAMLVILWVLHGFLKKE